MKSCDVIVIGAGHNGMTAATLLAHSGRKILLLEAADRPGGMAGSYELAPGYTVPALAHALSGLEASTLDALSLDKHGLQRGEPMPTVGVAPDQAPLVIMGCYGGQISDLSQPQLQAWSDLHKALSFQSAILKRFIASAPPQPDHTSMRLKAEALKAGLAVKRAGKDQLREFLRMVLMPVADVLEETDIDPRLAGLLAFDATLGIAVGPRSPTSILGLYYRLAGQALGTEVPVSVTSLIHALTAAATTAGVQFQFGDAVQNVIVENGVAVGVMTQSGKEFRAANVLSAISPVATFNNLVGPRLLDTGLARDVRTIRTAGNVTKINLALRVRPDLAGVGSQQSRIVFAPDINAVERAFNPSKYGELPEVPCFEAVLSAVGDDAVPDGAAFLSISVQNTPFHLKVGWDQGRNNLLQSVMKVLERLSPGIGKTIAASQVLAPPDIEDGWHVPGGHWHHGEWQVDRLFFNRPVFGAANYRTPIDGLYICGAGTHPGGGVNGLSGLNAAREMMRAGR